MMDDPRHARIRRLVTKGLTPTTVRNLESEVRRRTKLPLEPIEDECNSLVDVAADLLMQAICLLMGVPESDRHRLFECVEHIFDVPDESDFMAMTHQREAAVSKVFEYVVALIEDKHQHPQDDMLSLVIHAELEDEDPSRLTEGEFSAFISLLFSACAETTRNAIAGSMLAFIEWPEQLVRLRNHSEKLGTAVEEILRWTPRSPFKR